MYCYRLTFTAPFHIDSRGDAFHERTETFIHSDTLSAALLSAWALLEPAQAEQRAAKPTYKLSSAFPFYEDRYFLPRAINTQTVNLSDNQLQEAKQFRKIQWLEINLWKKSFHPDWINNLCLKHDIKQGCLAFAQPTPEIDKLWAEEERPRLAMDRITNSASDSQLFHQSRIWLNPKGGLYFLATFSNDSEQKKFEAALSLLADSGIGSDRSNGNGFFTWEPPHVLNLTLAKTDEPAVALSLVSPHPIDCEQADWLENAAYKLISRGGWIGQSGMRKQRLRLFVEGSVFKQPLQGQVVEITPPNAPNPVYRDGRGFFIKAG